MQETYPSSFKEQLVEPWLAKKADFDAPVGILVG
jgi:hypothetical protein